MHEIVERLEGTASLLPHQVIKLMDTDVSAVHSVHWMHSALLTGQWSLTCFPSKVLGSLLLTQSSWSRYYNAQRANPHQPSNISMLSIISWLGSSAASEIGCCCLGGRQTPTAGGSSASFWPQFNNSLPSSHQKLILSCNLSLTFTFYTDRKITFAFTHPFVVKAFFISPISDWSYWTMSTHLRVAFNWAAILLTVWVRSSIISTSYLEREEIMYYIKYGQGP